jgi:hypothetical protein
VFEQRATEGPKGRPQQLCEPVLTWFANVPDRLLAGLKQRNDFGHRLYAQAIVRLFKAADR